MKKIIVPTGYMGSGSSAITDLISEFKDCQNEFKTYEYVLLHCPNGLFDLEDKLLIGNNAIRSDEAIRSFENQMQKLYNKKFWWVGNYQKIISPDFMKITKEYINKIQEFNFPGYWYTHEEVNAKMFFKLLIRKPLKILTMNKVRFNKILKYSDGMRISYVDSKKFYEESHKYIYKIIEEISKGKENIILDQFLLPFNLFRVDNYFDDKLRVIVVARDPRDVFIINKYIWQQKQICVPFPLEVNEFCNFYKKMRESEKKCTSNKVLRINFEDLIYNYDTKIKEITKFLDFKESDHINKKTRFIPEMSIKNIIKSIINKDFKTAKGLLAGYKNSLFDKDLYDRISNNYDQFKVQRSFYTVSQELFVWIKENKDKKWMSYVHIDDAHFPENFFTYDTKDLKLIEEDFKRINTYLNNIPKGYKGSISYDLSLMYCDNIIKNIFKFLEKEKILNDTSIVITADHGFSYYFSPVREKYVISSYRENYNVPFIVWSKDIKNKMINNYCSTKDIPATLLDLVDIKIPKVFKGQSLLESKGQDYALLEYMGGGCPDIYRRPIILGVRTDNYDVVMEVYINKKFIDNEIKEVYNIRKDPFEYDNLFKQENIKEKIKKELQILENRYNEIISQYEVK